MGVCDICGKQAPLFIAMIEGTQLQVCETCAKYGKVLRPIAADHPAPKKKLGPQMPVVIEGIVEDYASKIKQGREKLNLTQEEFAKKLNERVSRLHGIEAGHHEPDVNLAKKLEKFLHITLIEEQKVGDEKSYAPAEKKAVTIGDIIKIKKR